jgi:hypothetical protein
MQEPITDRETVMKSLVKSDSLRIPLIFLAIVLLIVFSLVLELAYLGGVFTGRDAVIANDKRIENQASSAKPAH